MRFAKEFRRIAWIALEKNYWMAVLVTVVSGILSGSLYSLGSLFGGNRFTFGNENFSAYMQKSPYAVPVFGVLIASFCVLGMIAAFQFLISGATKVGVCRYYLRAVDGETAPFSDMFRGFDIFGKAIGLRCWTLLLTILWTLLFILPGIMAALRYSMAPYILAENPEMGVRAAVRESKKMMHGNKLRLFRLYLSFFWWYLLVILTAGLGRIFLAPYVESAVAAFYCEVSGQSWRLSSYGSAE